MSGPYDARSITLLVGTIVMGCVVASPAPALVRVSVVAAATAGIAVWIMARQDVDDIIRKDDLQASSLYDPQKITVPYAMMLHPEASAAIASLSALSSTGRSCAVSLVARTTESVVREYHAILECSGQGHKQGHGSAGTNDLRDRTMEALDAIQTLRMETGSHGRASDIVVSAENRLRRLFVRFRQIAGNKMKTPGLYGPPYPLDPADDHSSVR